MLAIDPGRASPESLHAADAEAFGTAPVITGMLDPRPTRKLPCVPCMLGMLWACNGAQAEKAEPVVPTLSMPA